MNSLQLVSKIRSKSDDLSLNISDLLQANHQFSSLDKALLSKQCLDLYELILKLKSDQEILEEKPDPLVRTKNFQEVINWADENAGSLDEVSTKVNMLHSELQNTPIAAENLITPPSLETVTTPNNQMANDQPQNLTNDQSPKTNDQIANDQPHNLTKDQSPKTKDPIANDQPHNHTKDQSPKTNDQIANDQPHNHTNDQSPKTNDQIANNQPHNLTNDQSPKTNDQKINETKSPLPPIEININKAIENKRIQYTVMPTIEEPKPVPLNETFEGKELSYNDKIAQVQQPNIIPLAEKTIEAPIDSIKSAINLNKKIAFVNILFNENVVEYAKAIERLNQAHDRNDAFRIHNELKHQHNWENSNELVQDLERLIKRRFA